jgi:hypothetical protein
MGQLKPYVVGMTVGSLLLGMGWMGWRVERLSTQTHLLQSWARVQSTQQSLTSGQVGMIQGTLLRRRHEHAAVRTDGPVYPAWRAE